MTTTATAPPSPAHSEPGMMSSYSMANYTLERQVKQLFRWRRSGHSDTVAHDHPAAGACASGGGDSMQTAYNAGGGSVYVDVLPHNIVRDFVAALLQDMRSSTEDMLYVRNSVAGNKLPPAWMQLRNVAIDGTPLSDEEMQSPTRWSGRYARELDIADAILSVKRQRNREKGNVLVDVVNRARRMFGLLAPLDEQQAQREATARWQRRHRLHRHSSSGGDDDDGGKNSEGDDEVLQPGTLPVLTYTDTATSSSSTSSNTSSPRAPHATPWSVLMHSVRTGQPLLRVANASRTRVDCYDIDTYLDATASLVWFCAQIGIVIGFFQGLARALRVVNVDGQFLRASRRSTLAVLNASVAVSVLKWAGTMAMTGLAFCAGDGAVRRVKDYCLPPHDARVRTTSNYAVGLACSGALVGVLPWWMLGDVHLAARMSVMGATVGGCTGVVVAMLMRQLVSLSITPLQVTNRQLRRYEALMLRTRQWAAQERLRRLEERPMRVLL